MKDHTTLYIYDKSQYIWLSLVSKYLAKPIAKHFWDETIENSIRKYSNLNFEKLQDRLSIYDTIPNFEESKKIQRIKLERMSLQKLQKFNSDMVVPFQNLVLKTIEFKKEYEQ